MSATTDLSKQLAALGESLKTTNTLISRLGKLTFQPGSEPLDGEGSVRVELAQDIHESLKQLSEDFELIKQEADDFSIQSDTKRRPSLRDNDEARITAKVIRFGEELTDSRQRFRNAQVAAKYASEQAKRKERQAILEGYRAQAAQLDETREPLEGAREQLFAQRRKNQQQKNLTRDEVLVNASSDVTSALRRTHDLLSTELTRSRFAQETLDQSTAALAQLGDDYSNLDNVLSTSRNLVGTLLKSQKSDTWYLETAFYILIATLCWLIFRRILYGPFFRLPLFIWSIVYFFLNWLVLKPFVLFLTVTGILAKEPLYKNNPANLPSTSRPPLIVQPSAQRHVEAFPRGAIPKEGIPVGAGGQGARERPNPILQGQMSEKIGKMAEGSAQGEQQQAAPPAAQEKEPVRRGDGTILQERGAEEPPNPKKKVFEAEVEDAQHQARKRDEL